MKQMRRVLALLFLFAASFAWSQAYTAVTSTNMLVDNGSGTAINPASGSTLCFLATNASGNPIAVTPAGGSTIPAGTPTCQTFNGSGGLTGGMTVPNGDTASPAGTVYTIIIANGSTVYLTLPKVQVRSSLFQINTYAVTANGTVTGIGYPHIACNAGAAWTSTTISPGASTCALISGIGTWQSYPQAAYCPAGQAYVTPQVTGAPFCLSPTLQGNGAPTGLCVNKSTYFRQDGDTLWGCFNSAWSQITGGGGGGLTSFQGRTTPAATLQYSDITGILANSPFSFTGSGGLAYDAASGTPQPSTNWKLNSGNLYGYKILYLSPDAISSPKIALNNTDGSAQLAGGIFAVSSAGVASMAAGSTAGGSQICTVAVPCSSSPTLYYQTMQVGGTNQTQRSKLNFLSVTGITSTDNSGNDSSDVSLVNIPNSALANNSITINAGAGLNGGGSPQLGGSTTLYITSASINGVIQGATGCTTAGFYYSPATGTCSDPTFAITSFTGGQTVEIGSTVNNPSFSASYSSTPNSAQITNTDGVDSPHILTTPFTSATISGSFTKTTQASTTFTLNAVSGTTKTANQNINWSPRYFGGVGTAGATNCTASGNNCSLVGATGTLSSAGVGNSQVGVTFGPYFPNNQKVYVFTSGACTHTAWIDAQTGLTFPMNSGSAITFTNQNGSSVGMCLYESVNLLNNLSPGFSPRPTN